MIHSKTPVTLAEVKEIVKDMDEHKTLKDYLKKFTELSKDKAGKLKDELKKMNNLKMKEEHIVKLVDFLPREAEDVKKIFIDVSLSEEETNAILDIVRKY